MNSTTTCVPLSLCAAGREARSLPFSSHPLSVVGVVSADEICCYMISSSRVVIATASTATTTTRTLSSLAAASALVSSTRLHLPKSATTTSTHRHRRHCSIGRHYGKDIVLDLRSNIRLNQSCDMSQSSITPPSSCNMGKIGTAISSSSAMTDDIEDVHRHAMMNRRTTYIDPVTDFTVFTELAHLKRGVCCGNICRHCPYGHVNVRNRPIVNDDDDTTVRNDEPCYNALVDALEQGGDPHSSSASSLPSPPCVTLVSVPP